MKKLEASVYISIAAFVLTGCAGNLPAASPESTSVLPEPSLMSPEPTFREPVGKERAFMAELLELYPAKLRSVDDHLSEAMVMCIALDKGKRDGKWLEAIRATAAQYDVDKTTGLEIIRVFSKYRCSDHVQLIDQLIVLSK